MQGYWAWAQKQQRLGKGIQPSLLYEGFESPTMASVPALQLTPANPPPPEVSNLARTGYQPVAISAQGGDEGSYGNISLHGPSGSLWMPSNWVCR